MVSILCVHVLWKNVTEKQVLPKYTIQLFISFYNKLKVVLFTEHKGTWICCTLLTYKSAIEISHKIVREWNKLSRDKYEKE